MSNKPDKLTFSVKKSLVVGTATAAMTMTGCTPPISNPVPDVNYDVNYGDTDDAASDAGDTESDGSSDSGDAEGDGVIVNPVPDSRIPNDSTSGDTDDTGDYSDQTGDADDNSADDTG